MLESLGSVTRLQFAISGKWETALAIERGDIHAVSRFWSWLPPGETEFAIEVFSGLSAPLDCFLGARFTHAGVETLRSVARFVKRASSRDVPFASAARSISRISGGPLLRGLPEFMEIGMLNGWQSFGPLRFWRQGDAEDPPTMLRKALAERANKRFKEPTPMPMALEIAHSETLPHWLGFVISRCENDRYVLDTSLAEACVSYRTKRRVTR